MLVVVGFLTLLQELEAVDIAQDIRSHRLFRSLLLKRKMCLEISLGTCPTVFSRGGMTTIALLAQQYGSIFSDSLSVSISTVTKSPCLALLQAKFL